jgi:HK97 family phage prohead protease
MQHKTFDLIEAKTDDGGAGTFSAYASVFENTDRGHDIVKKGAFRKTLEKWRRSGRNLPIILSHQWDDLTAYVGEADPRAVFEDDRGLMVQGQLFMDEEPARKVHKLMRKGLLTGWSFGYQVPEGGASRKNNGVTEISEIELFEVGPTLVGMNRGAQLTEVKAILAEEDVAAPDPPDLRRDSQRAVRAAIAGSTGTESAPVLSDDERSRRERVWREIREASAQIEAEEAEQAAARTPAPPQIPTTDRPFVTDDGERLAVCAAEDCNAIPTKPSGAWRPVHDRTWWCPQHKHLAGPEDHLPEPATYTLNANFGLRLNPESATAKELRRKGEERREEERERREADEGESKALDLVRKQYEREATIPIAGVRVHPGDIRVNGK